MAGRRDPPALAPSLKVAVTALVLWAVAVTMTSGQVRCPGRCHSCTTQGVANCRNRSITAPPKSYPEGTRLINLEHNYIRVLGVRSFNRQPTLEILKLSNNKITSLRNDAFKAFPNLLSLDLTNNKIYRIYKHALRNITGLRTLSLSRNRVRTINRVFKNLNKVTQLNLPHNRIQTLSARALFNMTELRYLDLRHNSISSIDKRAFNQLTRLRYLFLNNNPLGSLPLNVEFVSPVLQLMDLSNCRLTKVPRPLPSSLTDLRLHKNQIAQINHTDFLNHTALQLLALNDNGLEFIADGTFTQLAELKEIWLRENRLVYIPRDLPDNVIRLHMDKNSLPTIEVGVFRNTSLLNFLTVEDNQISVLHPNTFVGLHSLATLNLQSNDLRVLQTGTFRQLDSLNSVLLSSNILLERIEADAFQNLGNLTRLYMSHLERENFQLESNFLTAMPRLQSLTLMNSPGLAQAVMDFINSSATSLVLRHVTQVDFSYNTLTWISPMVRRVFPGIISLSLEGNPFRCSQRLRWLRDWMMSSSGSVGFYTYEEPVCETPYRLQGRPITSLGDDEWAVDTEPDGVQRFAPERDIVAAPVLSAGAVTRRRSIQDNDHDAGTKTLIRLATAKSRQLGRKPSSRRGLREKKSGQKKVNKKRSRKQGKDSRKKKERKSRNGKKGDRQRKQRSGRRRRKREVFVSEDGRPVEVVAEMALG